MVGRLEVPSSGPLTPWKPLSPGPLLMAICFSHVLKDTLGKLQRLEDPVPMLCTSHLQTPCLGHYCLACSSPSQAPPVKETGSLEAEDHLVFLVWIVQVQGVLVLMGICHPKVVADLPSAAVISHAGHKGPTSGSERMI